MHALTLHEPVGSQTDARVTGLRYRGQVLTGSRIAEIGVGEVLRFLHRDLEMYDITSAFAAVVARRVQWICELDGDAFRRARERAQNALMHATGEGHKGSPTQAVLSATKAKALAVEAQMRHGLTGCLSEGEILTLADTAREKEDEALANELANLLADNGLALNGAMNAVGDH